MKINKENIAGVLVNRCSESEALSLIDGWLSHKKPIKRRYIVTPNIEFIMLSWSDKRFRDILNDADLSIPDSSRLSWVLKMTKERSISKRILLWPFFLYPKISFIPSFPTLTGTDLMEDLIYLSLGRGYTIGFLGGKDDLAVRLKERLESIFKKIRIKFAFSDIVVDNDGDSVVIHSVRWQKGLESMQTEPKPRLVIPKLDILFVAFGQGKQEKWIANNLAHLDIKVAMGVGGALEYLVGDVSRAPKIIRDLGFEWLFRLIKQPWRIKRFLEIFKFTFLILWHKKA